MKLKQYLFSQLAYTFFPIFLGLYFISTIVFLVKIAALTSIITMNIFELFKLYTYVIPTIIFYTAPSSFFISLVITLSKLASEYELLVISSFGLNPIKILKIFFPITLLFSVLLMVISIGLIPKAKYLNEVFLEEKKKEANFNIKASEFGQKFGDWLIYISDKKDKKYEGIKLLKAEEVQDQFVLAKSAVLNNNDGKLSLKLFDGKSFHIESEEFNQIDYKEMTINDSIDKKSILYKFDNSFNYWKSYIKNDLVKIQFSSDILKSLFPLLSLFLVISFGYFNARYEKSKAVSYSLASIVLYYIAVDIIVKETLLHSLYIIPAIWFIGSYFIYVKKVKSLY